VIYLIDSSIYIFRAWQTLPVSTRNTHGEAFNAVTGFTETLVTILERKRPTSIAAAFDSRNRNAIRYRIHPEYKANRSPSPPELAVQFPRCQQVSEALGIATLTNPEIEADDIIGHLASLAHQNQRTTTIVSADKDLMQFIGPDDTYWNFAKNQTMTYAELQKRFGIKPSQMADMLALCGDKSDNIPGVPEVGQATAARLLKKWQTLDAVFDNIDGVSKMGFRGAPRVASLLTEFESTVRLSRQLTGLVRADGLPQNLDAVSYEQPDQQHCEQALIDAGFTADQAKGYAERTVGQSGRC